MEILPLHEAPADPIPADGWRDTSLLPGGVDVEALHSAFAGADGD